MIESAIFKAIIFKKPYSRQSPYSLCMSSTCLIFFKPISRVFLPREPLFAVDSNKNIKVSLSLFFFALSHAFPDVFLESSF